MTPNKDLQRYPGFSSSKTERPIHYAHRWQRDALIQASLDPLVTRIGPSLATTDQLPWHVRFAFGIEIAGKPVHVFVSDCDISQGSIPNVSPPYVCVTRSHLKLEPRFTAARNVWARKRLTVSPKVRLKVLELCERSAPDTNLRDVLAVASDVFDEPLDQILALLAQGWIAADLNFGLSHRTTIIPGPLATQPIIRRPLERLRLTAVHPLE